MSSDDEKDFAAAGGQHRENDDDDDDDDGPSSEASDSGSEDEDDGEKVSAQLEQLEAAVGGNPNSYEAHFQVVFCFAPLDQFSFSLATYPSYVVFVVVGMTAYALCPASTFCVKSFSCSVPLVNNLTCGLNAWTKPTGQTRKHVSAKVKDGVQSFFSHSLTHLEMKAEHLRPPLPVAHMFKALKRKLKPSIQAVD
jgi:hypothetical protein